MDIIPNNTKVITQVGNLMITGVVVGKSSDNITESYIIRCTDGQLPTDVYGYDTFTSPQMFITILEEL